MPKQIVINARFLTQPITGTQRFALELCREIKRLRPDTILLAPDNIAHQGIAKELDVQIVGRIKKGILWEQLELPILMRRYGNPLLVNLCNLAPILYRKNIVSILDLSFYLHPEWFSYQFSTLYNFFIPRAADKAVRIVTISENSKEDIVRYFKVDPLKVDIVYPSVSKEFQNPPILSLANPYGKYILAVSSIDPRKNFIGLISAFKACNLPDTKLLIVGSEHKVFANNDIKTAVDGDARIVFTGFVSDQELVSLYRNALVFAYPSFFEGFGIPPLEAMACGCPTLVSNVTSLPEVCGDASLYVDPYNIEDIKNGLMKLFTDDSLRLDLIKKGYERSLHFNWNISAQKLINIIDSIEDRKDFDKLAKLA